MTAAGKRQKHDQHRSTDNADAHATSSQVQDRFSRSGLQPTPTTCSGCFESSNAVGLGRSQDHRLVNSATEQVVPDRDKPCKHGSEEISPARKAQLTAKTTGAAAHPQNDCSTRRHLQDHLHAEAHRSPLQLGNKVTSKQPDSSLPAAAHHMPTTLQQSESRSRMEAQPPSAGAATSKQAPSSQAGHMYMAPHQDGEGAALEAEACHPAADHTVYDWPHCCHSECSVDANASGQGLASTLLTHALQKRRQRDSGLQGMLKWGATYPIKE